MAELVGSTQSDDFEPFCNWRREEGLDTLVLHLPEFKKEQMKIQITNLGVLKISGERAINATKRSRFYKEVKLSNECDANNVHAKFENGLLYVVMPKKISAAPAPNPPSRRSYAKKAIKVGLAVALVSAIGAYILQEMESPTMEVVV